jgi:hypothetical protein
VKSHVASPHGAVSPSDLDPQADRHRIPCRAQEVTRKKPQSLWIFAEKILFSQGASLRKIPKPPLGIRHAGFPCLGLLTRFLIQFFTRIFNNLSIPVDFCSQETLRFEPIGCKKRENYSHPHFFCSDSSNSTGFWRGLLFYLWEMRAYLIFFFLKGESDRGPDFSHDFSFSPKGEEVAERLGWGGAGF